MTDESIEQVRQLAAWLSGSDIALLELTGPNQLIRLTRGAPFDADATQATTATSAASIEVHSSSATVVRANSVGVLLHAHPLRQDPLVRTGDEVEPGQVMALLKIGTLLLPVPAPRAGIVSRVVAANESTVGWGEPLFELA